MGELRPETGCLSQQEDSEEGNEGEDQGAQIHPPKMPEHQKVRTPGKKYGDHHGQGQAQAGAAGCCGAVEGLHPGADAQAVDQDEIFRQQGGQCHPLPVVRNPSDPLLSFPLHVAVHILDGAVGLQVGHDGQSLVDPGRDGFRGRGSPGYHIHRVGTRGPDGA